MTSFQDQQSPLPDRDPKRGEPWSSASDGLVFPWGRSDNPYRMTHGVYMMRCARNGMHGRLESLPSRFEPEDFEALRSLGTRYTETVRSQIVEAEGRRKLCTYSIRTLHPAVFLADGVRCRSVYAEVFDNELRPVVVSSWGVEHLPRGAAVGALVYSWSDDMERYGARSIISKPAFDELADRASRLSLETLRDSPHTSMLMGLVFENLNMGSALRSSNKPITVDDVKHFETKRTEWGVEFHLSVPQYRVVASSRLDLERLEPHTVVYREFTDP